jgi:hypothetical protein
MRNLNVHHINANEVFRLATKCNIISSMRCVHVKVNVLVFIHGSLWRKYFRPSFLRMNSRREIGSEIRTT